MASQLTYRSYRGPIALNLVLAGVVQAVIGLEEYFRAVHTFFLRGAAAGRVAAMTPETLAAVYNFPPLPDSSAPSIAVIGFCEDVPADVKAYAEAMNLPQPSIEKITVSKLGAPDAATGDDRDGLAAMLQVVSALVPQARLTVYLTAPTERGCVEALLAAVHAPQTPDVICLGWGMAEERFTGLALRTIDFILRDAATLGITVCAAAGDSGSALERGSDLAGVQFPAASRHVLACGGSMLGLGVAGWSESVWNEGPQGAAGGGGVSALAAVPPWQQASQPPLSVRTPSNRARRARRRCPCRTRTRRGAPDRRQDDGLRRYGAVDRAVGSAARAHPPDDGQQRPRCARLWTSWCL